MLRAHSSPRANQPFPDGRPKLALANIKDYEFQLIEPTLQTGADKIATVRLVNMKSGKPATDAVILP